VPDTNDQRILLIDSDEIVRDSLKVLMESYGMQVEDFRTPAEFLKHNDFGGGCIVLGFNRHIVDGIDLVDELRKRGAKLPIIFIVGGGTAFSKSRALALGAAAYLDRPVEETTLMRTIKDVLAKSRPAGTIAAASGPH
jgi:two-component system response regulator FixJ